jgi:hypothetical protein
MKGKKEGRDCTGYIPVGTSFQQSDYDKLTEISEDTGLSRSELIRIWTISQLNQQPINGI